MDEILKRVWYVEAANELDGNAVKVGTAVAVWLKDPESGKGQRYLLTCGHVIRGEAQDGADGYGRVLPFITAWKPESAYKDTDQRKRADVLRKLDYPREEIPKDKRRTGASDWVLLKVRDDVFTEAGSAFDSWAKPPGNRNTVSDRLKIKVIGYPGGTGGFDAGVVKPNDSREFRFVENKNGVLTLKGGEETRPGMSGGAVVGPKGELWGLHRSSTDATVEYHSISIEHIRTQLGNGPAGLIPAASQKAGVATRQGVDVRAHKDDGERRSPMRTFLIKVGPCGPKGPNGEMDWQSSVKLDNQPLDGKAAEPLRVDLNEVKVEVAELFRDWALRGRVTDNEKIKQLGKILYTAIFNDRFHEALQKNLSNKERLHVSLFVESGAGRQLRHLPWEYLTHSRDDSELQLASNKKVAFSRCSSVEGNHLLPSDILNVLVAHTRVPSGEAPGLEEAIENAKERLESLADKGGFANLHFEFAEIKNLDSLETRLTKGGKGGQRYDVLHYIGTGKYDKKDMLLVGNSGYQDVASFSQCFEDPTAIIILEQCDTETGHIPADFGEMAPALIGDGVEAIIAFQDPIEPELLHAFNERLYKEISAGSPLQIAVQEARRKVSLKVTQGPGYVSPALFTKGPEELILVKPADESLRDQGASSRG